MNKKPKRKSRKVPILKTVCKWCGIEKPETDYFKCSLDHGAFICKDCINKKYDDLKEIIQKQTAIFICCHHLNIAYSEDVFKTLDIGEGIGHYVRALNLKQNKDIESFEESILKDSTFSFVPRDSLIENAKRNIQSVIDVLSVTENKLLKVKNDL